MKRNKTTEIQSYIYKIPRQALKFETGRRIGPRAPVPGMYGNGATQAMVRGQTGTAPHGTAPLNMHELILQLGLGLVNLLFTTPQRHRYCRYL